MRLFSTLFFFVAAQLSLAQSADSTLTQQADSALEQKDEQTQAIIQETDSLLLADSLEEQALKEKIAKLKGYQKREKEKLQAQLDSIAAVQENRRTAMQRQVDSLRNSAKGVPVIVFNDTLFFIYSKLGPFSASERANTIASKLSNLVENEQFDAKKLSVIESVESHDVAHEDILLFSVIDRDAFWLNKSRAEVAEAYKNAIANDVARYQSENSIFNTLRRVGLLLLVIFIYVLGIRYLNRGISSFIQWLLVKMKPFVSGLSFKNYEFLSQEREMQVVEWLLNSLKWIAIVLVLYLALPLMFSIFPATEGMAKTLLYYFLSPVKQFLLAIVGYIPEFITIVVILFITRYVVRFLAFLADEIQAEKLEVPGFYPDWAKPTFNLLKIVIYAFSFVVIFPYLPGSSSPIFQGVSVFLGLLISLGSSSAISNIIAGLVITYMRPFKIGDRVKIGETVGDVVEKTMLVTRLRTGKNEDVTIPNSAILNGSTKNYSVNAQDKGLILNTMVTIGYDVPWRDVHALLIGAAKKTKYVEKNPEPFVLQKSLDDFYVSYEINAYTKRVDIAVKIYSELYGHILDAFNEAGVEILSPHYQAERDGSEIAIPKSYKNNAD